ncbi:MAG: N-acetyltransferase family protein [Puniceicoccales bacterium]
MPIPVFRGQTRELTVEDLPACRLIYRRAAWESDPAGYSVEQRRVWASFADAEGFGEFLIADGGFVAEWNDEIAGFCSYENNGYIRSLYVNPNFQRCGVGGVLLTEMLKCLTGASRIWTVASLFSRGLFARHGFVLTEVENKVHGGVSFERYIMDLSLS